MLTLHATTSNACWVGYENGQAAFSGDTSFCETQWRHSVKIRLYNTPSSILHCISQLGENKGSRGHWVSQYSPLADIMYIGQWSLRYWEKKSETSVALQWPACMQVTNASRCAIPRPSILFSIPRTKEKLIVTWRDQQITTVNLLLFKLGAENTILGSNMIWWYSIDNVH